MRLEYMKNNLYLLIVAGLIGINVFAMDSNDTINPNSAFALLQGNQQKIDQLFPVTQRILQRNTISELQNIINLVDEVVDLWNNQDKTTDKDFWLKWNEARKKAEKAAKFEREGDFMTHAKHYRIWPHAKKQLETFLEENK